MQTPARHPKSKQRELNPGPTTPARHQITSRRPHPSAPGWRKGCHPTNSVDHTLGLGAALGAHREVEARELTRRPLVAQIDPLALDKVEHGVEDIEPEVALDPLLLNSNALEEQEAATKALRAPSSVFGGKPTRWRMSLVRPQKRKCSSESSVPPFLQRERTPFC